MDESLIDNINKTVGERDTLYHLGDWSFRNALYYRERIKCDNVILIWGNHDHKSNRKNKDFIAQLRGCYDMLEIKTEPHIVLNHYAMKVWNKSHRGSLHLYGHSHGSLPDDPHSLSFDVGVDCHNYRPISFDEVLIIMATKEFRPVDHHSS